MSGGIPAGVKDNVAAVLSSRTEGIPMSEFLSDYCNLHDEPLKFRDFGFSSLQSFIKSIPDVARMVKTDDVEVLIIGVGEPDSYKPAIPMKTQSCFKKPYVKSAMAEKFSHATGVPSLHASSEQGDDDLEPDQKGLWSVCLPLHLCPTRTPEALSAIFTQAGTVIETHFTDKWVFIRYAQKRDACQAVEMFSDLHVSIANSHSKKIPKKEKNKPNENHSEDMNGIESGRMSDYGANLVSFNTHLGNRSNMKKIQPHMNNSLNDNKTPIAIEQMFGRCHIDERTSKKGYDVEQEIPNGLPPTSRQDSKFGYRKSRLHTASAQTGSKPGAISLFVANIECEDDFREMIRPYHPVTIKMTMSKGKKIAFVNMSTEENASRAIANLHKKWQKTKCLFVHFDRNKDSNYSDSVSDGSISDTPSGARSLKMKRKGMPSLEVDSMPGLIHASELVNNEDNYHLDCNVHVTNFPINLPESTLRNAFVKYHVLDICMEGNGSDPSSTEAILVLATVYDAIQAVVEMDGSCVFGKPIKVDVPCKNIILRAVVEKERQKQRALYHPYGNVNLQSAY